MPVKEQQLQRSRLMRENMLNTCDGNIVPATGGDMPPCFTGIFSYGDDGTSTAVSLSETAAALAADVTKAAAATFEEVDEWEQGAGDESSDFFTSGDCFDDATLQLFGIVASDDVDNDNNDDGHDAKSGPNGNDTEVILTTSFDNQSAGAATFGPDNIFPAAPATITTRSTDAFESGVSEGVEQRDVYDALLQTFTFTPSSTDATERNAGAAVMQGEEDDVTRQLLAQPWPMPLPQPAVDSAHAVPSPAVNIQLAAGAFEMAPAVKMATKATTPTADTAANADATEKSELVHPVESGKSKIVQPPSPRLPPGGSNDVGRVLPAQPFAKPTISSTPRPQPAAEGSMASAAAGLQSTAGAMPIAPDAARLAQGWPATFRPQIPSTGHAPFLSGMKLAQSAMVFDTSGAAARCKGTDVASMGSGPLGPIPGVAAAAGGAAAAGVSAAVKSPKGSADVPPSAVLGRSPPVASNKSSTTAPKIEGPGIKPREAPFMKGSNSPAGNPSFPCERYDTESVDSALSYALGENLSITSEVTVQTAAADRRVSSALKRESESVTTPLLAVGRGTDRVIDALCGCMERFLALDEPTPSEEEAAFVDGVVVRGELGRAVVALKKEAKERKEAEVRAILGEAKRRRSKRLRSAALRRGREGRKGPPSWDHFSLRKMWKSGEMVTL